MNTKRIYSTLDIETYEFIKQHGYRLNLLIKKGLECMQGKCMATKDKEREKEIEFLKTKVKFLEEELKNHKEKIRDASIFNYVISIIIKKYNIDIIKEINEILKNYIPYRDRVIKYVNETILKE